MNDCRQWVMDVIQPESKIIGRGAVSLKFQISKGVRSSVRLGSKGLRLVSTGWLSSTTCQPNPMTQKSQQQQQSSSSSYNSSCDPSLSAPIEDVGGGWRCVGAVNDPAADQFNSQSSVDQQQL
jgi:hypothetical protein